MTGLMTQIMKFVLYRGEGGKEEEGGSARLEWRCVVCEKMQHTLVCNRCCILQVRECLSFRNDSVHDAFLPFLQRKIYKLLEKQLLLYEIRIIEVVIHRFTQITEIRGTKIIQTKS